MSQNFTVLEVGKNFNLIKNKKNIQNGAVLELLEGNNKGDWLIMIHLSNMTHKETRALGGSKLEVRLIKETDSFILPMLGCKVLEVSLAFDPMKYSDNRKDLLFDMNKISNMVTIVGIESNNNIIKSLRYANMPKKLYLALMQQYNDAKDIKNFSKKYDKWIIDLYTRYDDNQLWNMATHIGKMGE